ncbi:Uncharacterised protein [Chlamydia abortus]|nr:Uncharacterised protein [Chlamydia abortus]
MRAEREAFPLPPDESGGVAVPASSAAVISPPEKSCAQQRMLLSLASRNKRARTFSSRSADAVFQRGSLWPSKQRESSEVGKDLQAHPVRLSTHHRAEPISTSVSKKGCKEDPGKCRPVSLSSVPGKVMEQTVLGETTRHVRDERGSGLASVGSRRAGPARPSGSPAMI